MLRHRKKQTESYKDVFAGLISKGSFENTVTNTLTITEAEGNGSYTFQWPIGSNCEDYFIQHY